MTLLGLTHPAVRLQAIRASLPQGIPCSGPVDRSFLVAILPCVEQTSLYNSFNLSVWVLSLENSTCDALSVGMYLCPSDPDAAQLRRKAPNDFEWASLCDNSVMACTSYGGFNASRLANALPKRNQSCTVDPYSASRSDGLFGDVPPITSASIIDGLSQTLIAADKSISTVRSINDQADPYLPEHVGWWVSGGIGQTLLSGAFPPNVYKRKLGDVSHTAAWVASASSFHTNGINGLMADGSVRYIKETIDASPLDSEHLAPQANALPGVWQKLISRNGREILDTDAF